MKFFFVLVLAVFLTTPVFSQVNIATKNQVSNKSNACGWCALETLGLHYKIKSLYGVTARKVGGDGLTSQWMLRDELVRLKVPHTFSEPGTYNSTLLYDSLSRGQAVIVSLLLQPDRGHSVIVTNITDRYVEFLDSNKVGVLQRMPKQQFNHYWTGGCVVLKVMPYAD